MADEPESEVTPWEHPSFVRAKALPEGVRELFPHDAAQAATWEPTVVYRALSSRVLVVARTRVECAWAAYCDAVPGLNHRLELDPVLDRGTKVDEKLARLLFPHFKDVPYAH